MESSKQSGTWNLLPAEVRFVPFLSLFFPSPSWYIVVSMHRATVVERGECNHMCAGVV